MTPRSLPNPRVEALLWSRLGQRLPPLRRRLIFALAILACCLFTVFPRLHLARGRLVPPQSSSAGLGALLSQLGGVQSFAPLLNNRQPIEVYLIIANSDDVEQDVVRRLELEKRFGVDSNAKALKKLRSWVEVQSLRGGILQIESKGTDAQFALELTRTYVAAFQDRLSRLSTQDVERKRTLLNDQLERATKRLNDSNAALNQYRVSHRVASPEAQLGSSVSLLATLRARLQAKEVELTAVRQFATDGNFEVQRIQSELAGLRREIEKAQSASGIGDPFGFSSFATESSEYLSLFRDVKYAEALYDVYLRYLESLNIEEVSASINVQVVETPNLVPELTLRLSMIALALALAGLALVVEWHIAHSRLVLRAEPNASQRAA